MDEDANTALMINYEIINAIQAKRFLYDKGMDEYLEKWRDERPTVLKQIADRIAQQFNIEFDEKLLWSRWMSLVRKYKDECKKVQVYIQSGSSSQPEITSEWPLYKDMCWYEPFVEHLPQLSNTETASAPEPQQANRNFKKRKASKGSDNDDDLENLLKANQATLAKLEQQVDGDEENEPLSNYLPLIEMRHNLVCENLKYDCTKQVLTYINYYKKKKCSGSTVD
ncbi:hypothetical protein QAD02_011356 [Eretmocerus hayati]|uniref:Uncharacterized protein n=1 Tax=Eretmocerus hayati TaxID=131215 RepID=A0ACC2P1A6_9HYME|nr:hypothetical protein QAD02_011356 [Eretmocerus hayati]